MHKYLPAFALALLIAPPVGASEMTEVLAVIHRWVDGFNSADTKMAIATCANEASVIDDFPPHEWHGPGACKRWFEDFEAMSRTAGTTHHHIALEAASQSEISKEFAYVVAPAELSFGRKGTQVLDKGMLTVTLHNGTSGWRITGWVWSDQ